MNTQPYELTVAEALEDEMRRMVKLELTYQHAAQIIRNLHKENEELRAKLEKNK